MTQSKQTQAMSLYMRKMYRVIMILVPFFCLMAGLVFSTEKALGFYPDVPLTWLIVFDTSCVLYFIIGVFLCRHCMDEHNQLKLSYFNFGKWFVLISLIIQWNFISYLFPVAEFWAFLPFFLIAGVVFLDTKVVTGYALVLLASTFISWAVRPEIFMPKSSLYATPDLVLRLCGLFFIVLALCLVTFIVRRICVTDVTNILVSEAEKESLIDPMTGLNNRKAYYAVFEAIADSSRLGVVFSDVNGLKYTNDNDGHAAGDQLIVDFAQLLAGEFRKTEIFRISGDEFVGLCQDIDQQIFDQHVGSLQKKLAAQANPLAAVGAAYGHEGQTDAVSAAEKCMYEQKAAYYEKFPERKR